ncbi:MAG: tRNA 2-thiocytidine biosynthesis protein TtcA [Myxococcota bacterium]|jgi:tRNA 2-thiocytidine biosynthesis protein TtcA
MELEKRLGRQLTRANSRYGLFAGGDRLLVGISGGKDSWAMLHLLQRAQRLAPFDFTILPFHLDQAHPGFPVQVIRDRLAANGETFVIEREDTYSIVEARLQPGKTPCSLCSRLRRGILYSAARRYGCNKIALGHHREDLNETLLLNLFYSGTMATMPPRLINDEGDVEVIRPLALCAESDIAAFAAEQSFPIIPCMLCGRGKDLKRDRIKRLLTELETEIPEVRNSLLAGLGNVRRSHLLDPALWPGTSLDPDRAPKDSPHPESSSRPDTHN